jgi:hypothetical protein
MGGRHQIGTVGEIIPESWATSSGISKLTPELGHKLSSVLARKAAQRVLPVLLLLTIIGSAIAQTPPYLHGATVGTSPIQVASNNQLRRKIVLINPNATAIIAFCPAGPNRDTGLPVTCAVNGAGSITLQPGTGFVLLASNGADRLSTLIRKFPWRCREMCHGESIR